MNYLKTQASKLRIFRKKPVPTLLLDTNTVFAKSRALTLFFHGMLPWVHNTPLVLTLQICMRYDIARLELSLKLIKYPVTQKHTPLQGHITLAAMNQEAKLTVYFGTPSY